MQTKEVVEAAKICYSFNCLSSEYKLDYLGANYEKLEKLLYYIENKKLSKDGIIVLLNNIPLGSESFDYAHWIADIIYSSGMFPLSELWGITPFSDVLSELKCNVFDGSFNITKDNGCKFSFSSSVLTSPDQICNFLPKIEYCNKADIDNILNILIMSNANELIFPENFEENMIRSIVYSGYPFNGYMEGPLFFVKHAEDLGLNYFKEFLENHSQNPSPKS